MKHFVLPDVSGVCCDHVRRGDAVADPLADVRRALVSPAEREVEMDLASEPIPRVVSLRAKRNIEEDGAQTCESDDR